SKGGVLRQPGSSKWFRRKWPRQPVIRGAEDDCGLCRPQWESAAEGGMVSRWKRFRTVSRGQKADRRSRFSCVIRVFFKRNRGQAFIHETYSLYIHYLLIIGSSFAKTRGDIHAQSEALQRRGYWHRVRRHDDCSPHRPRVHAPQKR